MDEERAPPHGRARTGSVSVGDWSSSGQPDNNGRGDTAAGGAWSQDEERPGRLCASSSPLWSSSSARIVYDVEELLEGEAVREDVRCHPSVAPLYSFPDDQVRVVTKKRKSPHPASFSPLPVPAPPPSGKQVQRMNSWNTGKCGGRERDGIITPRDRCSCSMSAHAPDGWHTQAETVGLLEGTPAKQHSEAPGYLRDCVLLLTQDWTVIKRRPRGHARRDERLRTRRLLSSEASLPSLTFEQDDCPSSVVKGLGLLFH